MQGSERRTHLGVALLAAVAGIGGSLLAVGLTPEFVVPSVAAGLLFLTPDFLLPVGIDTLGTTAKPLLTAGAGLLTLLLYTGLAFVALSWGAGQSRERVRQSLGTLVLVGILTLVLSESLVGAAGAALGAAFVTFLGGDSFFTPGISNPRRRFLRAGVAAAGVVGIGALLRLRGPSQTATETVDPEAQALLDVAAERSFTLRDVDGLVSERFYKVDIGAADPKLSLDEWTLSVTGDAAFTREFTFDQLRQLPAEHRFVTLRCVNDPVNGDIFDTALWTGVPVNALLDEVGAPESCCVTLRGADGYFVSFERSALDPGLLAWDMNGSSISRGHGYPLRALVPGHWGETNAKWLTEIEIRESPGEGYWENRGWSGTGMVHTVAKLHSTDVGADTITLGGHAYAGTRGIQRVEVSTDGGETWDEATLSDTLPGATPVGSTGAESGGDAGNATATPVSIEPSGEAADAWRMWRYEYDNPGAKHDVVVRAVDGAGEVQSSEERKPFPEGASGWAKTSIGG
jgi:DMSO/TMAO reductase YedYZ molybdopterin-dependent catalytic subunit